MNELAPRIGQWYERYDGIRFEVVDVDDGDGLIEVQIEDGSLDEIDADEWPSIDIKLSVQPKDPTAPFDNVPLPDEADGGDPVELNTAAEIEPQKVANEELVNESKEDSSEP